MKVDRSNPVHWFRLLAFALVTVAAIVARPLRKGRPRRRVLFYGHRLAGNLLPIYRKLVASAPDVEVAFLTMDPEYRTTLREAGDAAILTGSLQAIDWLSSADAVVSDHGLHAMQAMVRLSDMKFFDVWHGIPFKGFDRNDFGVQRRYDEVWVASPLLADIYRDRFGFGAARVVATGYARTDLLVDGGIASESVRVELGIPADAPMILFAPTWQQDDPHRSPYPFDIDADTFLDAMSALATQHGAIVVVRGHLNDRAVRERPRDRVMHLPFAAYPWTERLLLATDVLVCDWSSIAFDFLLLNRPAVFLDVPAPFSKGFTLDGAWRYGEVADSMETLLRALEQAVQDPTGFLSAHSERMRGLRERLYGGMDDGQAAARCAQRLISAIGCWRGEAIRQP